MTGLWLGGLAVMQGTVLLSHNATARFSALGRMPKRELAVKCLLLIQWGFHLLVKLY